MGMAAKMLQRMQGAPMGSAADDLLGQGNLTRNQMLEEMARRRTKLGAETKRPGAYGDAAITGLGAVSSLLSRRLLG